VCVFDIDGTLTSCGNPNGAGNCGIETIQACQNAGWKIAVSTAGSHSPSECCGTDGKGMINNGLCTNPGQADGCIVSEDDWFWGNGSDGLTQGKSTIIGGDAANKGKALNILFDKYNNSISDKKCYVLFDDSKGGTNNDGGTYRTSVENAGFSALPAWCDKYGTYNTYPPASPYALNMFNTLKDTCKFNSSPSSIMEDELEDKCEAPPPPRS